MPMHPIVSNSNSTFSLPCVVSIGKALPDQVLSQIESTGSLLSQAQHVDNITPTLSVIIPVYNEAGTILQVVQAVSGLPVSKQIIIVDDGSTDGTQQLVRSLIGSPGIEVVVQERNFGKGFAIQTGIGKSIGDIVIVQDADLEYDPNDILNVIQPIIDGQTDVVFGSRYLANSHQDQSAVHRFGNAVLTGFSNWMTKQKLTDMETCYKAFRRTRLQSIVIEQRRFGFEPEITAKLAKQGILIREVPIGYKSRSWKEGKKIGIKDLVNTLWCIVKYRFFA